MSAPSDVPTVEQFAQQLQTLRIDCGEPSYGAISRATKLDKESISTGSITKLLAGKSLTKAEIVRAFVRGVLRCRDGEERPEHAEVVTQWFDRWRAARLASERAVADIDVPAPEPEPPAEPVKEPTASGARPSYFSRSPSAVSRASKKALLAPQIRSMNEMVRIALQTQDDQGRQWGDAKFGCYAFYDYDGEPIYVGQTNERLSSRVRRHLVNQRTDAVAMCVLDVREVAEMELWPLWEYEDVRLGSEGMRVAKPRLDALEFTIYLRSIAQSRLHVLLNEKIPPLGTRVELPPSFRAPLVDRETRKEWGAPTVRLARRASTLAKLTDVVLDRGEVSDGIRRAVVVQAARLTQLAASLYVTAAGLPDNAVRIDGLDRLMEPAFDDSYRRDG